jgi:hypothetical protein
MDNRKKGEQWISDGRAAYYVDTDIEVTEENAIPLCNFNKDEKKQPRIRRGDTGTANIYSSQRVEDEEILDVIGSVIYGGSVMMALKSADGMLFIDRQYLQPVAKSDYLEFYLRKSGNMPHIAVYENMFCSAIIMPYAGRSAEDVREEAAKIAYESVYQMEEAAEVVIVDQMTMDDMEFEDAEDED